MTASMLFSWQVYWINMSSIFLVMFWASNVIPSDFRCLKLLYFAFWTVWYYAFFLFLIFNIFLYFYIILKFNRLNNIENYNIYSPSLRTLGVRHQYQVKGNHFNSTVVQLQEPTREIKIPVYLFTEHLLRLCQVTQCMSILIPCDWAAI